MDLIPILDNDKKRSTVFGKLSSIITDSKKDTPQRSNLKVLQHLTSRGTIVIMEICLHAHLERYLFIHT